MFLAWPIACSTNAVAAADASGIYNMFLVSVYVFLCLYL